MSEAKLDPIRRAVDAFADGGLDAFAEFWDEDIDWRAIEGAPDDVGVMHGRAALLRYYGEWVEMFDGLALTLLDLRDAGGDRAVAVQRVNGRAKLSGAVTELTLAVVYTVRGGKIVRGREYATLDQALEAAAAPD